MASRRTPAKAPEVEPMFMVETHSLKLHYWRLGGMQLFWPACLSSLGWSGKGPVSQAHRVDCAGSSCAALSRDSAAVLTLLGLLSELLDSRPSSFYKVKVHHPVSTLPRYCSFRQGGVCHAPGRGTGAQAGKINCSTSRREAAPQICRSCTRPVVVSPCRVS